MGDCPRVGRLVGGCKFEPRYDLSPAKSLREALNGSDTPSDATFQGSIQGVLEKSRAKSYVRDVCIRCGKTVERTFALDPAVGNGGKKL